MKILGDFKTTVKKALDEIDPQWQKYNALLICGSHSPHGVDQLLEEIQIARENGMPFLGICYGHQLAAIEYARNILGIAEATSEEFGESRRPFDSEYVVKKLPFLKVGQFDGETYWNNYEVTDEILKLWKKPDNFITCQFHPEYQSSREKPHPLLLKFIYHARLAPLEV